MLVSSCLLFYLYYMVGFQLFALIHQPSDSHSAMGTTLNAKRRESLNVRSACYMRRADLIG